MSTAAVMAGCASEYARRMTTRNGQVDGDHRSLRPLIAAGAGASGRDDLSTQIEAILAIELGGDTVPPA